jgi:hypothetical protein
LAKSVSLVQKRCKAAQGNAVGRKRKDGLSGAFFLDQNEKFEMLVSLGKDAHCRHTSIGRQTDRNEMIRQKTAVISAP